MKKLVISCLIPLSLGLLVSFFLNTKLYEQLIKPEFSPPRIIFPIAWSIIYILLGISNYLTSKNKEANIIYYISLAINLIWPIIFFNYKEYLIALIWIILLLIFVIIMTIKYFKINKLSGLLQIPYILWILYATYLNYNIFILN